MINLIKDKIFEYSSKTGMITIYFYVNNRSEIIEKDLLDSWAERMKRLGFVGRDQVEVFDHLCNEIRTGADSFSVLLKTSIMSKGERQDTLNFRGQTISAVDDRKLTVGIITEISNRMNPKYIQYDAGEANKDSGTGILNKKAVTDEIKAAINLATKLGGSKHMFLAVMDIDDFKQVNDTYGHYFGDEVIAHFANALSSTLGSRGIVGRIGGDEFMILFTDC
jgi:predicted signal transduction protein with EAL and GGDEF domain